MGPVSKDIIHMYASKILDKLCFLENQHEVVTDLFKTLRQERNEIVVDINKAHNRIIFWVIITSFLTFTSLLVNLYLLYLHVE